jgi:hypothetical protein
MSGKIQFWLACIVLFGPFLAILVNGWFYWTEPRHTFKPNSYWEHCLNAGTCQLEDYPR